MGRRATWLAALILAEVALLEVHGPDGQVTYLNEHQISTLRQPNAADLGRYFPKRTHCVIVTTNARIVGTVETCQEIRDKLALPGP